MAYLKAELEAMAKLAVELAECAEKMHSAMRQLKDIGPKSTGAKVLDDACDDFQDEWSYGIDQISRATSGVTGGLVSASRTYQGTEEAVRAAVQAVKAG
ncbi:hypothetical protein [Streptomyces lincolnensis]|uniref:hypothetical protein n=1 Tax=Streptomyces lincolnensis TaxID=1915 RepID=UPI0037D80479